MRDIKPDVLCAYLLATVHLTRLSRLRRCRLSPCLCVPQCVKNLQRSTVKNAPAVRKSPAEAVLATAKRVAKRRCLAFRRSRAKRTPPARRRTSLNRVKCTNANTYHVRTSGIIPPYKKPESKGRLRSPLARLSPLSFVVQRKMEPPEGVRKEERLVKT